jgi:hypothetical protein
VRHESLHTCKTTSMVANKRSVLILLVTILATTYVDARPDDINQSVTASRLTRVASGVRMAADFLCSLTAPSWWYRNEVVTPTNISVYFVGLPRTGTTSSAAGASRNRPFRSVCKKCVCVVIDLY